ncbi:unnamed protein product [Prunus armeniaca]
MSSKNGSKLPSSQVSWYLWGGSQVYKKSFVANLHRLAKPLTDNVPCVDAKYPDARLITFRPFYFSLGITFPLSKLFKEAFCAMGCAPSQCTPNIYWVIMMMNRPPMNNICKRLELRLDMAKVGRAINITLRFREWRWLLSEYQKEVGGLPLPRLLRDGSRMRKADVKSSRNKATSSRARNVSPSRKKPKLPDVENIRVGTGPPSSAKVKHLVGAYSKKIGGMHNIRDVLLKPHIDKFGDRDLLYELVCVRSSSPAERQRKAYVPLRSLDSLHQSKDGD